jgi:hypothetical protein
MIPPNIARRLVPHPTGALRAIDELRAIWRRADAKLFQSGFFRYRTDVGTLNPEDLAAYCREAIKPFSELDLLNSFATYEHVINFLMKKSRFDIRPMKRLTDPPIGDRITVALRHDVDADVYTATRAARALSDRGLAGTFYLLHTSGYYGYFEERVFRRHPAMARVVEELLETDCEIGLHSDGLSVYCEHGINGAAAVSTEIAWLRAQGADVTGTVAHNSASVYGAENFEIFRDKALADRRSFEWCGRRIPLQVLDEESLGLTYEGNYPIVANQPTSVDLKDYLHHNPIFERAYDISVWLLARDSWVVARHKNPKELCWPETTDRMLSFLDAAKAGTRIVLNIHPEYVSGD